MKATKGMGWAMKEKIPDYVKNDSFEVPPGVCPLCLAYRTGEVRKIALEI
jgi:hypothetical protein